MKGAVALLKAEFHPLTRERFSDLEALFGPHGACGGCWCMFWRQTEAEFKLLKGEGNREALRGIVQANSPTGVLAYSGGRAVGWVAIAPRQDYPRLGRSRVLAPVDDQPVWAVSCFYIAKGYRRKGLTALLLHAAKDYARSHGARIVEGYPHEPKKPEVPDAFAWTGLASAFRRAGFAEVARRSETRPIMRVVVEPEGLPHSGV